MVSIILPNYNHSKFLQERLHSIFNQTYADFEVIILDDCSTDDSVSILKEYEVHPKLSYFIINEKNTGSPFLQWKKGIDLAIGKYIWIAESDDSCELDFLEKQVGLLEREKGVVAVAKTLKFNKVKILGENNHPIFKDNSISPQLNEDQFLFCPVLNVSSLVFLKENAAKACDFLNFNLIGDRVFYQEAFYGEKFYFNTQTQSYFRKEGDSVSSLAYKNINYFSLYLKEHIKFARIFYDNNRVSKNTYLKYIDRFFRRVRDRLTKKQKLSFTYLKIFTYYKLKRFVV